MSSSAQCIGNKLEMFFEAQDSLCKAQRCMKKYVDQHRDSLEFTVGDKVLLKLNLTIDCK